MPSHPSVVERLARLAPDQRAAATAPPGPVLCVAPAGSGKTTTLVARIAWLIDEGAAPESICAVTFNRRAAEELRERVGAALEPLGAPGTLGALGAGLADRVRIRTFHALGLEILRGAGRPVAPLLDRDEVLRAVRPDLAIAERRRLDTVISRLKLDLDVDPAAIEADPQAGVVAQTYAAYEREIERRGGLDFDDLVARSLRLLAAEPAVWAAWRERCAHLLVDEAQDLDRSQLRLALLLAAPANRIFLVGDDDQSIYGWRLADVRRLLGLAGEALPGLRRVDLEVNYRCPAPVLERSVRLIEHNTERFAKVIRPRPAAAGSLVLAASAADDVDRIAAVLASWRRLGVAAAAGPDGEAVTTGEAGVPRDPDALRPTFAILARTNRELLPAAVAAVRLGVPFRSRDLVLPIESRSIFEALDAAAIHAGRTESALGHGAAEPAPRQGGALLAIADLRREGRPRALNRAPGLGRNRFDTTGGGTGPTVPSVGRSDGRIEPGQARIGPYTPEPVSNPIPGAEVQAEPPPVVARWIQGPVEVGQQTLAREMPACDTPGEQGEDDSDRDGLPELLGWAAGCSDVGELRARIEAFLAGLAELRRDDAPLTLATAHGTKGLEFDHVAV
ncbi:MAG: ATP-dependent helicase, partial [Candidatus Limnocylindrales bacterium]